MQFKKFDWLNGHGVWAIIPCPTNMVSVCVNFLGAFLFPFQSTFPRFWGVFNKTIIPVALVGYEMIIVNEALRASLSIYHLISNARSWNNCYIHCDDHSSLSSTTAVNIWLFHILALHHFTPRRKTWTKLIIRLAPWAGKMNQILRCVWLPERARCMGYWLSVRSRWLDIG